MRPALPILLPLSACVAIITGTAVKAVAVEGGGCSTATSCALCCSS